MPQFLFIFGFNTPEQIADWEEHRWDAEDSEAVFIKASSEEEALAWGREIAGEFIQKLYGGHGIFWQHCDDP